jgi:hypothetical protein
MESLLFGCEDSHAWYAEEFGIVERAYLQYYGIETGTSRRKLCAAMGTEFPCNWISYITKGESLRRSADPGERFRRYEHEHVLCAAAEVLARTTVALRFKRRCAHGGVAQLPAVASAFK